MLPKNFRLTKKKDFENIIKRGRGIGSGFLILKFLKNNLSSTRVGFVVSKKISNKAVVRNKVKRRLREAVRSVLQDLRKGYDLVFLARPGLEDKNFQEIKEKIEALLKKAQCLKA